MKPVLSLLEVYNYKVRHPSISKLTCNLMKTRVYMLNKTVTSIVFINQQT